MKKDLYSYRKITYPYESKNDYLKKFSNVSLPSWITDSNFMCIECNNTFKYSDIECKNCSKNTYLSLNIGIGLLIELDYSVGGFKLANIDEKAKNIIIEKVIVDALPFVLDENDNLPKMYRKDDKTFIDKKICYRLIDFYINEHNKLALKKPVIIQKISVRKLFGYHSYDIIFNGAYDINVIYGSNAIGKTTIFKIIELFFASPLVSVNEQYEQHQLSINDDRERMIQVKEYLYKIPFSRITIRLTNGECLDIKKIKKADKIIISAFDTIFEIDRHKYIEELQRMFIIIKHNFQSMYIGKKFLFIKLGEYKKNDYYTKYFNKLLVDFVLHNFVDDEEYDSGKALKYGIKLLTFWKENYECILDIRRNTIAKIKMAKYKKSSVARIIEEEIEKTDFSGEDIDILFYCVALELEFNNMKRATVYNYNNESYNIFRKFMDFSTIFYSFYYEKDPSEKIIDYDKRENKIIIRAKKTLGDERFKSILSFDDLSSGEKRIFDLLFNLIMNTMRETIVLIDEPEVSLHTEWQMQFSDVVQMMKKVYGFAQVIVASHSPFITSGHEEYIVSPSLKKVKKYE